MEAVKSTDESGIQTEIDALRPRFPNTQDLYREACALLFFRYGITPTANKLYQLVRKGSMSAPAEALSKFWVELREKSRVRVNHADLPDDLKVSAGELIGSLWAKALAEANASLSSIRAELAAEAERSRAQVQAAESAMGAMAARLEDARLHQKAQDDSIRQLEQALAAETAKRQLMENEVATARQALADLRQSADDARVQLAADMEQLRRSQAAVERQHLETAHQLRSELELERAMASELKEALERSRAGARELADLRQKEEAARAEQAAGHRQLIGRLEGELKALGDARAELTAELAAERDAIADLTHRLSSAIREADRWQLKTIDAHREIETLKAARLRKALRETPPELNLGIPSEHKGD